MLEVRLGHGVDETLRRVGERALTVELALLCGDLIRKDAIVYAGPAEEGLGFRSVPVSGIEVFWRQRVVVDVPVDRAISDRVRPRRLDVRTFGDAFVAEAAYA